MKKKNLLILSVLGLGVITSCNNGGSNTNNDGGDGYYPLTLTTYDSSNSEITQTYTKSPEKVICGNLSSAETLIALGLKDKIIGMTNPDNMDDDGNISGGEYDEEVNAITKLGDKKTISFETILNAEPDFIFSRTTSFAISKSSGSYKAGNLGTPSELNRIGITMYSQKASISNSNVSLDDIFTDIENIGKIFNVQDKASEYISELKAIKDNVVSKIAELNISTDENLKNALIMTSYGKKNQTSNETYGIFKPTLQEKMLNMLGYTNYYENEISGASYTAENLVNQNPELIVYVTSLRNKEKDDVALELMYNNAVLQDVPAIKNKNIITIAYDDFMDYGARNIKALDTLYNFLYGTK